MHGRLVLNIVHVWTMYVFGKQKILRDSHFLHRTANIVWELHCLFGLFTNLFSLQNTRTRPVKFVLVVSRQSSVSEQLSPQDEPIFIHAVQGSNRVFIFVLLLSRFVDFKNALRHDFCAVANLCTKQGRWLKGQDSWSQDWRRRACEDWKVSGRILAVFFAGVENGRILLPLQWLSNQLVNSIKKKSSWKYLCSEDKYAALLFWNWTRTP